jgi:16S rRNA (cytidine1402-2'-O)-methyltransferase
MPKIYLIPCPLAPENGEQFLAPITKEIVKNVSVYFVEEIKTARRFLSSLKLGLVIENLIFEQLNKDTSTESVRKLFQKYPSQDIGIISEAGCPAIADPGSLAVEIGHQQGYQIVPIPGPSSIFMALMASGFNGQGFSFNGYLSIDNNQKIKELKQLEALAQKGMTQIFMETPYRNNQLLETILKVCSPNTKLCIACNLTANDQFIETKSIQEWLKVKDLKDLHKLPTIFLLK